MVTVVVVVVPGIVVVVVVPGIVVVVVVPGIVVVAIVVVVVSVVPEAPTGPERATASVAPVTSAPST